jgi:plasmid replication initiation protein
MKTTDVTLAQANALTQARYNFTAIEKRAVYFIIKEVRRQFIETNTGQKDLFDDLVVRINTEDLQKTDSKLKHVYDSLRSLRKKSIYIEDNDRVLDVGYINYFEHKKRDPHLDVQVSRKILPYLVELAGQFTSYSLTVAISLKTKYAQRFYEYCSQFEHSGFFVTTQEQLRDKLMLGDAYPRWSLLQKYVIDVAQKELQKAFEAGQCNLYFTYKPEKSGRTVTQIKFFIHSDGKTKSPDDALKLDDCVYHIRTWLSMWLAADKRPKNKRWIDGVIKHIQLNPDLVPQLYQRLNKLVKEEPGRNHAALARHIIEEDFLPED